MPSSSNIPNYPNYILFKNGSSMTVSAGIDWGDINLSNDKCICPYCNCKLYKEADIDKEKSQLSEIVSMLTLRGFSIKSIKEIAATVLKALVASEAETLQLKEENNGLRALIGDKLFKPALVMTLLNKLGHVWDRGPKETWWKGGPMHIKQAEAIVKQTLSTIDKDPKMQKTIKEYMERELKEKTETLTKEFTEKLKNADAKMVLSKRLPEYSSMAMKQRAFYDNTYLNIYDKMVSDCTTPELNEAFINVIKDTNAPRDTITFVNQPASADIMQVAYTYGTADATGNN